MRFETRMNIQIPESTILRGIQGLCEDIELEVNSLHKDDINPINCAADFRSIISKINTLKDKIPGLEIAFTEVDNMVEYLEKSPGHIH